MVIVLASFIVLGSVMMFVFSQYTKSDKRKLLMQNASSMASITSVVDITNNGAPELLKVFVRTFSLNIDADIFVTDLEGNVLFGAYANSTSNIGTNFIPQTKISADIVKCASEGSYTGDGRKNGIYDTPYYVVGVPLYSVAETSSSEAGGENSTRVPVGAVFAAMNAASLTEYQSPHCKCSSLPQPPRSFWRSLSSASSPTGSSSPCGRCPPQPKASATAISPSACPSQATMRLASLPPRSTTWQIRSPAAKA